MQIFYKGKGHLNAGVSCCDNGSGGRVEIKKEDTEGFNALK